MHAPLAPLATRRPDPSPDDLPATPIDRTDRGAGEPHLAAFEEHGPVSHRPEAAPAPAARPRQTPRRVAPARSERPVLLPVQWAAALGLGWPLVTVLSMVLEPVPTDPNAPVPLVIEAAGLALLFGLLTTAVAAGIRHRLAAVAGVVTGVLSTTFVVACPVSGHHAFGLWWVAELGLVAGMLAVSLVALGRSTR